MSRVRNAPILAKLAVVAVVAVLGVAAMAVARLSAIRPSEMEARETKTRHLVQAAQSVIAGFHKLATEGKLTEDQAKAEAIKAVRSMRYDKTEYFWINDMRPVMVMHPVKPELEGQDLSTNKDPNGKLLFVEFVNVVRAQGAGFVSYDWPKPNHEDPVPKLSYVSGFAPWGWVIGSGIYIDDVDAIVAEKRNEVIVQTAVVLLLLLGGLTVVSLGISRPLRRLTVATSALANGETDVSLPPATGDEIGRMARAVGVLRESLTAKQHLEQQHDRVRQEAEADKRRAADDLANRLDATVSAVLDRVSDATVQMQHAAADLSGSTGTLVTAVQEIAGRAGESTSAASRAAQEASDVSGTVTGLTTAADTIGGVIEVIRKVAAQTNLLALNATIEAARAGELGKGFAVVANEVKELAQQSAQATDQIAKEVEAIQGTSQEAAMVMGRMAETVRTLGTATQEVASAIAGSGDADTTSVRRSAQATGDVARRIQEVSDQLTSEAERLRAEFAEVVARLRA